MAIAIIVQRHSFIASLYPQRINAENPCFA
jgi:hypothetical protein